MTAKKDRTLRKNRFTTADIVGITRLVIEGGLSEAEAVRRTNRDPKSWWKFKCAGNNREDFAAALETAKAARIESLIQEIYKSATGEGMKQRDWRAADRLLQILDDRFKVNAIPPPPNVAVNVFGVDSGELRKIAARVYAEPPQPKLIEAPKKEANPS